MILKQGDCLNLMKSIPDKSVDMILCDLPYGRTANKWDKIININKLWKQYKRIIKDHGCIALFGIEPFSSMLRINDLRMYRYDWAFVKNHPGNFMNVHKMPMYKYENISVFYKSQPTYNPQMRLGFKPYSIKHKSKNISTNYMNKKSVGTISNGERYPINMLNFKLDKDKLHPTQKPIKLLEYLIHTLTKVTPS